MLDLKNDLRNHDVVFLKVFNLNLTNNFHKELKITRAVTDRVAHMWPSIVPTSGLVVRASFLKKHYKMILSTQPHYNDIWIDLRINICALQKETKAFYSEKHVIRRLHTFNDSSSGGIIRAVKRQISALKFRKHNKSLPPCRLSVRYLVTNFVLHVLEITRNLKSKLDG